MIIEPDAKTIPIEAAANVAIGRGAPKRLIDILVGGAKLHTNQSLCHMLAKAAFSKGESAVIHGRVGCGKSMIGAMLMLQCARHRMDGRMCTVAGLMLSQKSWFGNTNFEKPESPIEIATRCKLLVVDELVAVAGSLYDHTQLTEIIKARYDAKKPTLILTNIIGSKLAEVLSKHIVDRLLDGGGLIELNGASMRGVS